MSAMASISAARASRLPSSRGERLNGKSEQANCAFTDTYLQSHIFHGHLFVAVLGQEDIHRIQDQAPNISTLGDLSHRDL